MIDIHTHPCSVTKREIYQRFAATGEIDEEYLQPYWEAVRDVDKAVALALWAPASGIQVNNEFVAAVVARNPHKIVGFASLDPLAQDAVSQLDRAVDELKLCGVKLSPIYQHFAPDDRRIWPLYSRIQELGLPIMWHQGATYLAKKGPIEEARPIRLDKVASSFPRIKMILAHFGYPWAGEAVAMLRKHENLYTDVSVLSMRPWFLYNAMIAALEYGAEDKVLLGSDYPAATARQTVQALCDVNRLVEGTGMPRVPSSVIESIIDRDSLAALGISTRRGHDK